MAGVVSNANVVKEGICPYCGGNSFYNSWGRGNAQCATCLQEFFVTFEDGKMVGKPLAAITSSEEL